MNTARLCFFAAVLVTTVIALVMPEYIVFGFGPMLVESIFFLGVVWALFLSVAWLGGLFRRPKRRRVRRQ